MITNKDDQVTSQDYFKIKEELTRKQKAVNPDMPTIDSLHDENGEPTFDLGSGELDCKYPIFEPHLILKEMQKILEEVRSIRDSLGFYGIEVEDKIVSSDFNDLYED